MPAVIPAHQIDNLILREFQRQSDPQQIGDRYQQLLIQAHRDQDFHRMAMVLEYIGDYFSRSGSGIQEAVRMYQSAVFCLSQAPDEAALTGLVDGLDYNSKEYWSSEAQHITPDVFQPDQSKGEPDLDRPDLELSIRLLFKAGTGMLLQMQPGRAADFYQKARHLAQAQHRHDNALYARILANHGVVLRRKEEFQAARQYLQAALEIFKKFGLRYEEGKTLSMLAGIMLTDIQLARRQQVIQTDYAEVGRLYQQALELYKNFGTNDPRGMVRTYTGAGILSLERKNYQRAFQHFTQAAQCARGLNIVDLEWPIQWGLGCYYLAKKDYDPAEAQLALCIGHIEKMQDELCSDEGKATFIENVQFVYGRTFEVYIGCQKKFKRSFVALLGLMERSRAQAMQDFFSSHGQTQHAYDVPFSKQSLVARGDSPQRSNIGTVTPENRGQDTEATQRLKEQAVGQAPRPFQSPKRLVFKILPKHTVTVVVDEKNNVLDGHLLRKGRAAWEQDMETFRTLIGRQRFGLRDINSFADASLPPLTDTAPFFQKLYTELLGPIQAALEPAGELLLIEPDGPLWQLPLHLLLLPDGRFAGEVWPMVYAPSFDIYRTAKTSTVLPIHRGDPFFFGGVGQAQQIGGEAFERLGFAEREVETVAKNTLGLAEQYVFLGPACTESAARQHFPGSRIIHLATHGQADAEHPDASYVVLLGSTLTAADVRQMVLPHCELVVLSACRSGLGKVMSEGMIGLARAFQLAGARSVLVSLWSVEDESTQLMMEYFYKNLTLNGGHKALALQAAMQTVRKKKADPQFWAPFILIGVEDCVMAFGV